MIQRRRHKAHQQTAEDEQAHRHGFTTPRKLRKVNWRKKDLQRNLLRRSGWSEVPGGGVTLAGPAAAFQNFLYLTVQGTNNRIYDNLLTSVGWTGWAAVPGNLLTPSGPAATVFNGELWYVVRGTDDRIYRNRLPAAAASDWTGWVEVPGGGFTPSGPGAAATASTLYLVVRGEDNAVYLNQATSP